MSAWVHHRSLYDGSETPLRPMASTVNIKHMHAVWCGPQYPHYVFWAGGDWGGQGPTEGSFQNEVGIYDLRDDTQTILQGYQHTANGATYQFHRPDQLSLAWDSQRGQVWAWPGCVYGAQFGYPGGTTLPWGTQSYFGVMSWRFDGPTPNQWWPEGSVFAKVFGQERPAAGLFDPVTDRIFSVDDNGFLHQLSLSTPRPIATAAWRTDNMGPTGQGIHAETLCSSRHALAYNEPNRGIYVAGEFTGRIYRYQIDVNPPVCTWTGLVLPTLGGNTCKYEHGNQTTRNDKYDSVYSPLNHTVYISVDTDLLDTGESLPHPLYPDPSTDGYGFPTVYALDLATMTIATLPTTTPAGERIRGRHTVCYCGPPYNGIFMSGGFRLGLFGDYYPTCDPYPFTDVALHAYSGMFFYQENGDGTPDPPDPPTPPTLTLRFDGTTEDRVGRDPLALAPDGSPDGVFTLTLASGGAAQTFVQFQLTATAGIWDTIYGSQYWILGVSSGLSAPLLNATNGTVDVTLPAGETLTLFCADQDPPSCFAAGTALALTATLADGSTLTAQTTITGDGPMVKTATFTIGMEAAQFPAGTAPPTTVRVTATGPATKTGETPWSDTASLTATIPFDDQTEAGEYTSSIDLLAGTTVLKTVAGPAFTIASGIVSVTYKSPTGATVTIG